MATTAVPGAPRNPVPIAEAAHHVGLHPNAVRRLVEQGLVRAVIVKAGGRDSWLVDAAALQAYVHAPAPGMTAEDARPEMIRRVELQPIDASGQPLIQEDADAGIGEDAGASDAEELTGAVAAEQEVQGETAPLAASIDLSLGRAQALERYTHSLLGPLVELLRDREAAIERREAVVRHQAERIGRLEREIELLRLQLARASRPRPWPAQGAADPDEEPDEPAQIVAPSEPAVTEETPLPPSGGDAGQIDRTDQAETVHSQSLHQEVESVALPLETPVEAPAEEDSVDPADALARQVERLREDLRRIAARLEAPDLGAGVPAPQQTEEPEERTAEPGEQTTEPEEPASEASPPAADQERLAEAVAEGAARPEQAATSEEVSPPADEQGEAEPASQQPLDGEGSERALLDAERPAWIEPTPGEQSVASATRWIEAGERRQAAANDPFAEAEAAIRELQHALAARTNEPDPEGEPEGEAPEAARQTESPALQAAAAPAPPAPLTPPGDAKRVIESGQVALGAPELTKEAEVSADVPQANAAAGAAVPQGIRLQTPIVSPAEAEALRAMRAVQEAQRRAERRPWWRVW